MTVKSGNDRIIERIKGVAPQSDPVIDERDPNVRPGWKDPTCPKCGIVLGNKMMYCCSHMHCPVGLN